MDYGSARFNPAAQLCVQHAVNLEDGRMRGRL
jgi:hypothetical protein